MIQDRIEDGIIIATFANAPMNTITRDTVKDLKRIIDRANTDDSVKGIVFTGAGKTFSAGFDLPMFLGFKDLKEVVAFFEEVEQIYIDLFMCRKPVVAAINGAAVAGGLITAMACDYRIAKNHPKITLGMTEIKIGLGLSIVQTEIMRWG
ncbi:MAG: enoyl-CoA hydratase/isomerase family protein, partial [Spirochaetes bacterium]|nr:enoyl-CoA hydratase/isomerase family protein [Spirochaetota bacterium]